LDASVLLAELPIYKQEAQALIWLSYSVLGVRRDFDLRVESRPGAEATGPHRWRPGRGSPNYGYLARRVKNRSGKIFRLKYSRRPRVEITKCGKQVARWIL
jgi:hypothetical protein